MEKKYKPPKTLGACADRLLELKTKRLQQQKLVDQLAAEEAQLKEHIINTLPASEATGVAGRHARVSVDKKEVPRVTDWDAFYKHIKKTGSFELLTRAVSREACNERWEAGKSVPGVEKFPVKTVSLNKL